MIKKLLLFSLLFAASICLAQKEVNIWYFGIYAGLDFNSGTPVALTDGKLNTNEGCATICDANGQLLFYTDGLKVWNRNHQVMPNGTGLLGDKSSSQSAIIVPKPGSTTIYYLFTTAEKGFSNGFCYSEVDMSLNGGFGDITAVKNILIKTPVCEKLTAIKHENNDEYWVMVHDFGGNGFYAYKINASGINLTPVVSNVGVVVSSNFASNALGYMKFSPDGNKIIACHEYLNITELFDFDTITGVVSNPRTVTLRPHAYGAEFSQSGNVIYISTSSNVTPYFPSNLFQYDLTAANIQSSEVLLDTRANGENVQISGALQMGPDGKIYNAGAAVKKINVINNPDVLGLGCNYVSNAIDLGWTTADMRYSYYGLPQFIQSYFNSSITAQNFCLGSNTQFSLTSSVSPTSILWDFGDGTTTSSATNPIHQYSNSGNYTVTVTVTTANGVSTKNKQVTISAIPVIASTITNQTFCGSVNQNYDLSQFNATLLGLQSSSTFGVAYFSSMNDATNHSNALPVIQSIQAGTSSFYAKVYNLNNLSCHAITNFTVTLVPKPVANTLSNIFVCDDFSNDEVGTFNLASQNATLLGSQSNTDFTISYHISQVDADAGNNDLSLTYQNNQNPQTIFARVENKLQPSCYATTTFQIGLYKQPIANSVQTLVTCDDNSNDGKETFDLASQTASLLNLQSASDFDVSYHISQQDANDGINAINVNFANSTNPQQIFARIENKQHKECFDSTSFNLTVREKPVIDMKDIYSICEGNSITITAPNGFSSYSWSNGINNQQTTINLAGNYSLTTTKNYGDVICSSTKDIVVYNSNIATITNVITEDFSESENYVQVFVSGDGDYEYSINGINYQDNNTFYDLLSGTYIVYVRDKKGCGIAQRDVTVLNYPKVFTPNGDGFNDLWSLNLSEMDKNTKVNIFDRYGKLLYSFIGNNKGWDGKFQSVDLPSTDYWFVINREDGREYKGHFSLKR